MKKRDDTTDSNIITLLWRRCRDLNPSAGKTDLPDFESGPFNHLGTSPDMFELRVDGEKTEQIIKFC